MADFATRSRPILLSKIQNRPQNCSSKFLSKSKTTVETASANPICTIRSGLSASRPFLLLRRQNGARQGKIPCDPYEKISFPIDFRLAFRNSLSEMDYDGTRFQGSIHFRRGDNEEDEVCGARGLPGQSQPRGHFRVSDFARHRIDGGRRVRYN